MFVERNATTTRHLKSGHHQQPQHGAFPSFRPVRGIAKCRGARPSFRRFLTGKSCCGYELHRFPYAAPSELRKQIRIKNDGTQPLELLMRVSQIEIEPVLEEIHRCSSGSRGEVRRRSSKVSRRRMIVSSRLGGAGKWRPEARHVSRQYLYRPVTAVPAAFAGLGIQLRGAAELYMIQFRSI